MLNAHGGNVWQAAKILNCDPKDILDFSANLNPVGPPGWAKEVGQNSWEQAIHYPDPDYEDLRLAAARFYQVKPAQVWPLNGCSEIFPILTKLAQVKQVITFAPSYLEYQSGLSQELPQVELFLDDFSHLPLKKLPPYLDTPSLVVLAHPNNPTGSLLKFSKLCALAKTYPQSLFVLDLAFWDFLSPNQRFKLTIYPNLIFLFSLTKVLSLPGVRIGFLLGPEPIIQQAKKYLPPWSVSTFAQNLALNFFCDPSFQEQTRIRTKELKQIFLKKLRAFPLTVIDTPANFILLKSLRAPQILQHCFKQKILLRSCANFSGLGEKYLRLAIRPWPEQERLLACLKNFFGYIPKSQKPKTRSPKVLMIQGTGSNVGKSLLVAGLGRLLARRGIKVAPFKPQNMALNSFVTPDGLEIGRAQALQAQACFLEPRALFNPILLKPSSETRAQVIALGKPVSNMSVEEYIKYKPTAFELVKQSFHKLRQEFDVLLVEGAGSPVEINLKSHDIVNMNFALWAQAKVLLVGDIDLGGVFASFWGTFSLLTKEEQDLILGFVINKFRGRQELLNSGIKFLERLTAKPVLGIIPYLDLNLPAEDSVSLQGKEALTSNKDLNIAVIKFPHIANFTDFDPLKIEPDVNLCFIQDREQLKSFSLDALILPGSKNVFQDLAFLRKTGLAQAIWELVQAQVEIVGICGGYQILGERICDSTGWEGFTEVKGLGLLPITTQMAQEKTLTQTTAKLKLRDQTFELKGYEIHHGQTRLTDPKAGFIFNSSNEVLGAKSLQYKVWGTYLHDILANDDFRHYWLNSLRLHKGLAPLAHRPKYDISAQLDKLADSLEQALDVDTILEK